MRSEWGEDCGSLCDLFHVDDVEDDAKENIGDWSDFIAENSIERTDLSVSFICEEILKVVNKAPPFIHGFLLLWGFWGLFHLLCHYSYLCDKEEMTSHEKKSMAQMTAISRCRLLNPQRADRYKQLQRISMDNFIVRYGNNLISLQKQ